ncbi:hypothetical protein HGG75_26025 [Ochrobactrum pseudogrignonense]|nr:hypothetical protein [Brucella pseudogrignonensis]
METAESTRKQALSASLCLAFALGAKVSQLSLFNVAVIGPYVAALMIAGLCWECSNRLWRMRALKLVAPQIAASFGQTCFSTGWEALDIEQWLKDQFSSSGSKSTSANSRTLSWHLLSLQRAVDLSSSSEQECWQKTAKLSLLDRNLRSSKVCRLSGNYPSCRHQQPV